MGFPSLGMFVQDSMAWAMLAAHALEHSQHRTARDAYAALGMVDRMQLLDEVLTEGDGSSLMHATVLALQGLQEDAVQHVLQVCYSYHSLKEPFTWPYDLNFRYMPSKSACNCHHFHFKFFFGHVDSQTLLMLCCCHCVT